MSEHGVNPDGERVVRASRRADGTYRKERKIRDGYVPPDEQVAYVSRGKQVICDRKISSPAADFWLLQYVINLVPWCSSA